MNEPNNKPVYPTKVLQIINTVKDMDYKFAVLWPQSGAVAYGNDVDDIRCMLSIWGDIKEFDTFNKKIPSSMDETKFLMGLKELGLRIYNKQGEI